MNNLQHVKQRDCPNTKRTKRDELDLETCIAAACCNTRSMRSSLGRNNVCNAPYSFLSAVGAVELLMGDCSVQSAADFNSAASILSATVR